MTNPNPVTSENPVHRAVAEDGDLFDYLTHMLADALFSALGTVKSILDSVEATRRGLLSIQHEGTNSRDLTGDLSALNLDATQLRDLIDTITITSASIRKTAAGPATDAAQKKYFELAQASAAAAQVKSILSQIPGVTDAEQRPGTYL